MKNENIKIAAVVVTHNRLELLKECVHSLRNQTRKIDEIFIINNSSTDGTFEWLKKQTDLAIITQENLGSSGGQYTGIRAAYEKGYDWIWCMDDDAEPLLNTLEGITKYIREDYSAVCPNVLDEEGERLIYHRGNIDLNKIKSFSLQTPIDKDKMKKEIVSVDFASFVGILVNRKAVERIGLPNQHFFIHHDDVEYSLRLKKYGDILLIPKETIIHKEVNNKNLFRKRFLWKISYRMKFENYWINYFTFRNQFWLLNKYVENKTILVCSIFNDLQKEVRRILLYDSQKIKRFFLIMRALLDAMFNRLEIRIEEVKNKLYGQ